MSTVLSIGATGSIGRATVPELLASGHDVRALVRDVDRARRVLPAEVTLYAGDLVTGEGLADAVAGVDAIVLTHGGEGRDVDYDGVRRVLHALDGASPHIVLMTSMGITRETTAWGGIMNWKRRAERLVRAYGAPYTMVRPGWFDYQASDENDVLFEQGDGTDVETRRGVARSQIAKTLAAATVSEAAVGKTFELFAQHGALSDDWDSAFSALLPDDATELRGGGDRGVALSAEPQEVLDDIAAMRSLRRV